jgi:hypothetical protein
VMWLPLLGPSAMVLLCRLQMYLDVDPDGRSLELDLLSQMLGLGPVESKHAPLFRAITRLVHFGLAKRMEPGQLAVRGLIGLPAELQLRNLRDPLRTVMGEFVSGDGTAGGRDLLANGPWPTTDLTTG